MVLRNIKLHLVTYGKGDYFNIAKFEQIKNKFIKPEGGLWASPVNVSYGWINWCKDNDFGDLSSNFEFVFIGNIFKIDSVRHAALMPWVKLLDTSIKYPDFEKMVSLGCDAIYLTAKGEAETRFSNPSLYGWDCESVLVMNPKCINIK